VRPEDVRNLYDTEYAASYDAKFLTSPANAADTAFEIELLGRLLTPTTDWLDVACGTGYFLRQFPHIRRTGLDLSPAMLAKAQDQNPGAELFQHDFRQPRPEWVDRFGLVSCMWYAYSYVESMRELSRLIENLASWTAPAGQCFVPLADPRMIARRDLSYEIPYLPGGQIIITGILWSFVDEGNEKVHAHLVTPQVEYMTEQFGRFFGNVSIVRYPDKADGITGRAAMIATDKR
jgi:SAM-dependent methyltransferase